MAPEAGAALRAARTAIEEEGEVYLSVASIWEIAIKFSLGKLPLPEPVEKFIPRRLQTDAISPLPIRLEHVLWVAKLPWHHRDPFDRLLVAQAQSEGLSLVTADPQLRAYDLEVLWAGQGE